MSETAGTNETPELSVDVLKKLLADARAEAAANRVKGKEAVEKVKNDLTAEYDNKLAEAAKALEAEKANSASTSLRVAKLQAALDATVPDRKDKVVDIASRLLGSTEDELKADAARVAALYGVSATPTPPPATDPSQGKSNETLPLNGDKLLGALDAIINKGR